MQDYILRALEEINKKIDDLAAGKYGEVELGEEEKEMENGEESEAVANKAKQDEVGMGGMEMAGEEGEEEEGEMDRSQQAKAPGMAVDIKVAKIPAKKNKEFALKSLMDKFGKKA